jgi:hypothetical protein
VSNADALERLAHATMNKGRSTASPLQALLLAAAEVFTNATDFNDFAQEHIQLIRLTVNHINTFLSFANQEPDRNRIVIVDSVIIIAITEGKKSIL